MGPETFYKRIWNKSIEMIKRKKLFNVNKGWLRRFNFLFRFDLSDSFSIPNLENVSCNNNKILENLISNLFPFLLFSLFHEIFLEKLMRKDFIKLGR